MNIEKFLKTSKKTTSKSLIMSYYLFLIVTISLLHFTRSTWSSCLRPTSRSFSSRRAGSITLGHAACRLSSILHTSCRLASGTFRTHVFCRTGTHLRNICHRPMLSCPFRAFCYVTSPLHNFYSQTTRIFLKIT